MCMDNNSLAAQTATKWHKKRGSLIMALHEIQGVKGYIPWEDAVAVAEGMNIPLARIYEVLTFYNFFKLNKKLLLEFNIISLKSSSLKLL